MKYLKSSFIAPCIAGLLAWSTATLHAESQDVIKFSVGAAWDEGHEPDEDEISHPGVCITIDYHHIWSRGFGLGVMLNQFGSVTLITSDLLYRFRIPIHEKAIDLSFDAGLGGYFLEVSPADAGFCPSAHYGAALDYQFNRHWGMGVQYRRMGVIGGSLRTLNAGVVYTF